MQSNGIFLSILVAKGVSKLDKETRIKLEIARKVINKKYKSDIVYVGREHGFIQSGYDVIPTGSLGLDIATRIMGWPKGRIVELYGPESSGKTTLALHALAECQKAGGIAGFIDAEAALDVDYAEALGVNLDELVISRPDYGEQALDITDTYVKSGAMDLIVIDSVASLTPKAELEGDMEKNHVGLQARMISQALRKLTGIASNNNTCLMFVNQIRMKICGYVNPETTTGGRALKFYATMRVDIRRTGGDKSTKNSTRVRLVKNKVGAPWGQAEFDIVFGAGIDSLGELVTLASEYGIITKAGSWYSYGEDRLGQGVANSIQTLVEHKLVDKIRSEIIDTYTNILNPTIEIDVNENPES